MMMRQRLLPFFLCVALAMPAWADFAKGEAAYQQGDFAVAIREFKEDGSPRAFYKIGAIYFTGGKGVRADKEEAVVWLRKAAEGGHAEAQDTLGTLYKRGVVVKPDKVEAAKWFRMSAEQGHARAEYNLYMCYQKGEGVGQNQDEAVKWLQRAAEHGDAEAQYSLGGLHFRGSGTIGQNKEEAIKWYRKAAAQGYLKARKALLNLGVQ